jgi:hypothetical protein
MDAQLSLSRPAAELSEHCNISDEARALAAAGDSCDALLDKLAAAGQWPDAMRVLAYALPKPQAIAWAWHCATVMDDGSNEAQRAALQVAQAWLREPNEEHRAPAHAASEAAGLDSAAGCVALAVFWSGGSMAPPDAPPVAPPAHLSHHLAACAALLAAGRQPEHVAQTFNQFLALGREVAAGKRPC